MAEKPTAAELADRVEYAAHLLDSGLLKGEAKRRLSRRYKVCARTCETYLARARRLLEKVVTTDRPAMRAESLAFYRAIVANPKSGPIARLKARERIDKLLALDLKLPPIDVLCEYLGCTPAQLAGAIAGGVGGPLPAIAGADPAGPGGAVPPIPEPPG